MFSRIVIIFSFRFDDSPSTFWGSVSYKLKPRSGSALGQGARAPQIQKLAGKFSNVTEELQCHTEFYRLIWLDDHNQERKFRSSYIFGFEERTNGLSDEGADGAMPPEFFG